MERREAYKGIFTIGRGVGGLGGRGGTHVSLCLLHKWNCVGICLGNNKIVDVEKLLEAGRWEVALKRAIRPRHV